METLLSALTVANAALFFVLSLAMFLFQIKDITYPTIVEVLFAIGSLVCFLHGSFAAAANWRQ